MAIGLDEIKSSSQADNLPLTCNRDLNNWINCEFCSRWRSLSLFVLLSDCPPPRSIWTVLSWWTGTRLSWWQTWTGTGRRPLPRWTCPANDSSATRGWRWTRGVSPHSTEMSGDYLSCVSYSYVATFDVSLQRPHFGTLWKYSARHLLA